MCPYDHCREKPEDWSSGVLHVKQESVIQKIVLDYDFICFRPWTNMIVGIFLVFCLHLKYSL